MGGRPRKPVHLQPAFGQDRGREDEDEDDLEDDEDNLEEDEDEDDLDDEDEDTDEEEEDEDAENRHDRHPLYQAASALAVYVDQLFDENDPAAQHPAVARLTTSATLANVKLAAALTDDDVDELGMTIAYLKRALKAATNALDATAQCEQENSSTTKVPTTCAPGSSKSATALSCSWAITATSGVGATARATSAAFTRRPSGGGRPFF